MARSKKSVLKSVLSIFLSTAMEKWFSSLGIKPEQTATIQSQHEKIAVSMRAEKGIPSTCSKLSGKLSNSKVSTSKEISKMKISKYENLPLENAAAVAVIFVIYANYKNSPWGSSSGLHEIKDRIYNASKAIFSRTKSARLYVVSPSGNVAKISVGSENNVNPAQTKEMLDSYTYLDSAYHSTLNLPLRENAAKYCFNIDEKGTYCSDFAYQLPDLLGKAQNNTSIINPYTEIGSLYFTIATSTGGELFYDTTNFADDVINHMYPGNGANCYDIISATGFKNIHLNGKLTRSNGIDTDGDVLTDWNETDTESCLTTWDQSGNIVLPTFAKCIETEGDNVPTVLTIGFLNEGINSKEGKHYTTTKHNVNIIGIIEDQISKKTTLQISSWGGLFTMNYEDLCRQADMFTGICITAK